MRHVTLRAYTDLARWWPLFSPVADYAEEAGVYAELLARAGRPVREVLELGAGGGHNAFYLKARYALTLTDLSAEMLDVSRAINPECTHLAGDMRTLRLGRDFDAVFVHDAIDYMTTEADLLAALTTATSHLRDGGVLVVAPDHVAESYVPGTDCGGSDDEEGRGLRYLEWTYDPDPTDTRITTEYAFLLRTPDGRVESFAETHQGGLFPTSTWRQQIEAVGLRVEVVDEAPAGDWTPRRFFLGHR